MNARHVMVCYPSLAEPSTTVAYAARLMRDHRVRVLPVVSDLAGRHLVGIVTDRDLVNRGASPEERGDEPVGRYMTAPPIVSVHRDTPVDDVWKLMATTGLRRIPVVTEGDRLIGIVTRGDGDAPTGESRPPSYAAPAGWRASQRTSTANE